MESFAKFIIHRRPWFISLLIISTIISAYIARDIKTDNSIEIWLKQDDPALRFYNDFKKDFGNEEFLLISINDQNIFTREWFKVISKTSAEIKKINGVKEVTSLSSAFRRKIEDPYFKERLSQNRNSDHTKKTDTLKIFKEEILKDELYINNLISKDGKTTAIVAIVDITDEKLQHDAVEFRKTLIADVRRVISQNFKNHEDRDSVTEKTSNTIWTSLTSKLPGFKHNNPLPSKIHLAGPSVVNATLDKMSQDDLALFVPLMFCASFIALIILFRKIAGIILPVSIIGLSNIWTMGMFALAGNTMNMVSGIITPVIFIIALANTIHIINFHYSESASNSSNADSITHTIKNIGTPCFFTCLTTAIGFLSLAASDVSPVKITGIFTSFGIIVSFFISVVLITISFSFFSKNNYRKEKRESNRLETKSISDKILQIIISIVCKHKWSIAITSVIITGIFTYGITKLKIESDLMKAFPESSEISTSNHYIENHLTGLLPLEIIVKSERESETVLENKTLKKVEDLQGYLNSIHEITNTMSLVDFIKRVNTTVNYGDSTVDKIPATAETAASYLNMASLYGGSIVDSFHSEDNLSGRISVRMKQIGSSRYREIVNQIEGYIEKNFSDGVSTTLTGVVHLLIKMQDYLLSSQIKTLSLALIVIFLVMMFLLRSIKLALISMIPNTLPIIITFGLMGFLEIKLDSGTVMIASIAIGIAVDDTIHFLYRFRKEHKTDYTNSIRETITNVGRAIIFTSVVAFCGFMVLGLSNFKPIQYFGLLTAITMVTALLADLLVLPCCLLIIRPSIKSSLK